ncbi:ulp1 protease family, C-terminal catalytic domain-containing protein [Tanacetum coccineum]|uniref:Ulp1 protease family, C-terminal catalytic domain-containing protein n=1 Tax=Tanacetum coccineum TaxID=301880 RepID=A0ABQ5EPB7_9ASTR
MEEHNLIETVCYKRRRKSIAKNPVTKNKIVSIVSNDSEDSIHEEDANVNPNEVIRDVIKSVAETINYEDQDVEKTPVSSSDKKRGRPRKQSYLGNVKDVIKSVAETINYEDQDVEKTPVSSSDKKRGRPRKQSYLGNVKVPTHTKKKAAPPKRSRTINSDDNVLFDSNEATKYATQLSIDEHQQQEKESRTKHKHSKINIQKLVNKEVDEGYKQKKVKLKAKENLMLKTVGSKRKFEDDTYEDDVTSSFSKGKKKKKCKSSSKKSDGKKRKVKNKVRISIRTRTTPTSLFSAMCILNPDKKKCIRDMGLELLYLHSTRCDHFDVIRQTPAIRYWKSGQMTYREKLEIEEYGGFGRLPKHEAIKLQSEDFVKMIEDKLYNIRQDVMYVREILNEGLTQYPDSKKLNLVRKRFEEYDADNDDTTGVKKDKNELPNCDSQIEEDGTENVDTTGKDNESDSPASSDGDNQKNDFRVMFHKKCGNFFKNKECDDAEGDAVRLTEVEDVDINKKGVDSINEGDALGLAKVEGVDISEKVEKENQQIGNEESSSQMDEDSVNPSLNEVDKVDDSSHATVLDSVIEVNAATEEAEDVDMNENVENEKKKNGNEESSSQDFVHPILNEDDKVGDSSHATGVDSVIQGGDAAIETENVDINEKVENKKQKNSNEESSSQDFVYPSLNEDDKVGDSPHATCVDSVIEGDVVELTEFEDVDINEKVEKEKQQIGNEESSSQMDQDSVNPSLNEVDKVDDSSHATVLDSITYFDDVKHDIYNGPDLRSPYEYFPVDVKITLTDVEKIVADTLFAMTGSKMDIIFKSQSGLELNHLEMETLTPTLMASSNVIDVWAELLNILEVYKDESFPLRYYFKISVYIPEYYIGKYEDDEKLALFIAKMKESFNEDEKLMSLQNFQMVFFPVCHEYHIYLICVDFNKGSIHLIDNSSNGTDNKNQRYKGIPQAIKKVFVQYLYHVKHPKAEAIEKAKISRMNMKWRTTRNSTDCGVFTMFHMESYIGDWICGLDKESKQQNEQLKSLRSKFAAKIILSDFNLLREEFMKLVQVFQQKNEEERKKAIDDAIANRNDREKIEEAPIANKDECQKIEEANIPFENS